MKRFSINVKGCLESFHQEVIEAAEQSAESKKELDTFLNTYCESFSEEARLIETVAKCRRKHANRSIANVISGELIPTYRRCSAQTGKASFQYMVPFAHGILTRDRQRKLRSNER